MSRHCPDCGKRMDTSWRQCPYCAREQQARKGKMVGRETSAVEAPMDDRKERQPTRVASNSDRSDTRRETQYYPGAETDRMTPPPPKARSDNRRIVGVLVCYTWDSRGQLFSVREGRTHIGSGEISEDPSTPVEVQCSEDSMLSSDHAMILARQGQFYLRDLSSTNGTTLNGKPLRPESAEDLPSPSEIRAGNSVFTFVRFDVAAEPMSAAPEIPTTKPTRAPTDLR